MVNRVPYGVDFNGIQVGCFHPLLTAPRAAVSDRATSRTRLKLLLGLRSKKVPLSEIIEEFRCA